MTTHTILLDLEFTGLDNTYITDNEIVEVKMWSVYTQENATFNNMCKKFTSTKPIGIYGRMQGMPERHTANVFSAVEFMQMLTFLGVNEGDTVHFIGFGVDTDKKMLRKYAIYPSPICDSITDIKDMLMLSHHEQTLAEQGRSMEMCYFLLTGKVFSGTHSGMAELEAIHELYMAAKDLPQKAHLEFVPFGHCAGMPIAQYVANYRRAADGHRFNNSDLFAAALHYYIEQEDMQDRDHWLEDGEDDLL